MTNEGLVGSVFYNWKFGARLIAGQVKTERRFMKSGWILEIISRTIRNYTFGATGK